MSRKETNTRKKQLRAIEKHKMRKATVASNQQRQLHEHIEQMLAAYIRETDIPAARACLVHDVKETEGGEQIRYWFEHHEDRAKIVDLHPDVYYLFTLANEMWRAYTALEADASASIPTNVKEGLELLNSFMTKYDRIVHREVADMVKGGEQTDDPTRRGPDGEAGQKA